MGFIAMANRMAERAPLPDLVTRAGIEMLVARTRRELAAKPDGFERDFAREMEHFPVALHADAANAQHYELPPHFFELILGPRQKYSCCLYPTGAETLAQAEENALAETIVHASLADGQDILELGCGWGSLTLYMAERFPASRITAVSNSAPQRGHIEAQARARGIVNVRVITADMNDFAPDRQFDRVVSVEMFEHMANWRTLLGRVRSWMKPEGRLFIHIFTHRATPYRFDHTNEADWIAQHFFTGGIMPSHSLVRQFPDLFRVEADWIWNGSHYARTADDWLINYDRNAQEIGRILDSVYGPEAGVWNRRWRLFFLATAGLFGHAGGKEWGISHYRLAPA